MAIRYLVPDGKHLPVSGEDGKPDHRLMGAAWAALHGGYRGNKYEGPGKEEALRKLKALYKSEGMELPSEQASEIAPPRFALLLSAPGAGNGLLRIPLALTGEWVKSDRRFAITAEDLEEIRANFAKRANGEINVDYEHASEQPEVALGGAVPSAGRIVRLDAPESLPGASARRVLYGWYEPTEKARAHIAAREYRYISPAIDWRADNKQTGEPQGTTLTSVALTNRPFLEELPEIHLSEAGFEEVISRDNLTSARAAEKEQHMSKRLTLKPIADGDEKGHHGVFDGDDQIGHITHEHLSRYADTHPEGTRKASEIARAALLTEIGAEGAEPPVVKTLIEAGRKAQQTATEQQRAAKAVADLRRIFLAEKPNEDEADALLATNQVTLAELRAAERARKRVDAAFQAGKILPIDREIAFRAALADAKGFDEWIARRPAAVSLRPQGVAGAGSLPASVQEEIDLGVKALMSERSLNKAQATRLFFETNPEVYARYRAAQPRAN